MQDTITSSQVRVLVTIHVTADVLVALKPAKWTRAVFHRTQAILPVAWTA